MRPSLHNQLRDVGDRTLRADHQRAAFRERAHSIESESLFLFPVDATWIIRGTEVENEIFSHDEKALWRDRRAKFLIPSAISRYSSALATLSSF